MKTTIFTIWCAAAIALACSQPVEVTRHSPEIKGIKADRGTVYVKQFVTLEAEVVDKDKGDKLTLTWSATTGTLTNTKNNPTQWQAPTTPQMVTITLTVNDGYFEVSKSIDIVVKAL